MTQGPVCPRICNGEFACPDLGISFAQVCLVWHLNLLLSCHELIAKEIWSVESSNAVTTCNPEPDSSYFTSCGRTKKNMSLKGGNMFMSLYVGNPMSVVYPVFPTRQLKQPCYTFFNWCRGKKPCFVETGNRWLWNNGGSFESCWSHAVHKVAQQKVKHQLKRSKCPKTTPLESRVDR